MKSVLISIQPKWCELIASGNKTVEVRKNFPNLKPPFKVYIYETKGKKRWYSQPDPIPYYEGKGKVIGEFVCDKIDKHSPHSLIVKEDRERATAGSCLTAKEIRDYVRGNRATYNLADLPDFYGWHISDLVIYEKPKPLTDFAVQECLWHNIRSHGCVDASGERCYDCRLTRPPQSWCYVEG